MSNNFFNFSTDKNSIFLLLIDVSGSMSDSENDIRKGIQSFIDSFENFPEKNSISVSLCKFDSDFYKDEFKRIDDLCIGELPFDGATALYYSICKGAKILQNYIDEVVETKKILPNATFIVFSDGEPCRDPGNRSDAKKAIRGLNNAGITTAFVAFGEAISSKFGDNLGFMSTIDVNERSKLVEFLGEDLSQSVKRQSKSLKSLGSNFFSKTTQSNSEKYSAKTQQALEDDDWYNDI